MLIVKIMSGEDTADTDLRKSFILHADVVSAAFERRGDGTSDDPKTFTEPYLTLVFADGERLDVRPRGNVFVMNERGTTVASYGVAPIVYADGPQAGAAANVRRAVSRFLSWQLPNSFAPDGGIRFDGSLSPHWPTGTNLFSFDQAEAMLRHVLDLTDAKPST